MPSFVRQEKTMKKDEIATDFLRFKVGIKSRTPVLMDRYVGQDIPSNTSQVDRAEMASYRHENGNLAIPNDWLKGCILGYMKFLAAKKWSDVDPENSPKIQIDPILLDLGMKDYKVDIRAIPVGRVSYKTKIKTVNTCIRPLISNWETEFIFIMSPDFAYATIKKVTELLNQAGSIIGIGSNRKNGFGRFEVVSVEQI